MLPARGLEGRLKGVVNLSGRGGVFRDCEGALAGGEIFVRIGVNRLVVGDLEDGLGIAFRARRKEEEGASG